MAKYLTIECRFADDVDPYSESVQTGMVNAVKTIEQVLDARVVGIGEGPDPETAPENAEQDVPPNPDNQDGGVPQG